jgi:3-polyprenyl-4-hydroxybenzoate decarboxylase
MSSNLNDFLAREERSKSSIKTLSTATTDHSQDGLSDNTSSSSKSVSFAHEPQVLIIPSRLCTISSIKKQCDQNMIRNESYSSTSSTLKKVKFYKRIIIYPTACRKDLICSDIWYNKDEIKEFERRTLQLLQRHIN